MRPVNTIVWYLKTFAVKSIFVLLKINLAENEDKKLRTKKEMRKTGSKSIKVRFLVLQ